MATQAVRSQRGRGCAAAGGVGGRSSSRSRRESQARAASAQTSLSLLPASCASSDIRRTRSAGMLTCAGSTGVVGRIGATRGGSCGAATQRHADPALADATPRAMVFESGETGRIGGDTGHAAERSALASGNRGIGASQVIGGLLGVEGTARIEHLFYHCT
jgi:hypothetical protein